MAEKVNRTKPVVDVVPGLWRMRFSFEGVDRERFVSVAESGGAIYYRFAHRGGEPLDDAPEVRLDFAIAAGAQFFPVINSESAEDSNWTEARRAEHLQSRVRKFERYTKLLEAKICELEAKHGESIVKKGMSRQARKAGDDGEWIDYGCVTLSGAAECYARDFAMTGEIEVRDLDQPHLVHCFPVERLVIYRSTRLRGKADLDERLLNRS